MRFSKSCVSLFLVLASLDKCYGSDAPACSAQSRNLKLNGNINIDSPFVSARILGHDNFGATVMEPHEGTKISDVIGCCLAIEDDASADCESDGGKIAKILPQTIGTMPQMNEEEAIGVLNTAKEAWKGGMGAWPQLSLSERVASIEKFIVELKKVREDIISVLMWEIGKNKNDATAEFDRTIKFIEEVINVIKTDEEYSSSWKSIGSTKAFVKRAAIGIIMCLGPYNYPLNETYATLIPALLMGNVVVMKIPTVGGLAHLLTMDAFAKTLPKGAINFVSGGGRATMPPLMKEGSIDGLAFIGGSNAADNLIKDHPNPHRLKLFLQLEAKNMGIFLQDLFEKHSSNEEVTALLDNSIDEAIKGTLSYNGQRCTALKLLFVPKKYGGTFVDKFVERVESMSVGLPWQSNEEGNDPVASSGYSQITPLPNVKRVRYMKELIDDAVSKGATIVNENGGEVIGGDESTLMVPAVLYPVTPDMRIYEEEQFGPVIPIAPYDNIQTILDYGRDSPYGQQCSIFTSGNGNKSTAVSADILDKFSSIFGKININSQCGRSPDTLPFSGRRSSAMGVMSVTDALREFSIPTVVSYKSNGINNDIMDQIETTSKFLE